LHRADRGWPGIARRAAKQPQASPATAVL